MRGLVSTFLLVFLIYEYHCYVRQVSSHLMCYDCSRDDIECDRGNKTSVNCVGDYPWCYELPVEKPEGGEAVRRLCWDIIPSADGLIHPQEQCDKIPNGGGITLECRHCRYSLCNEGVGITYRKLGRG